MDTLLLSRLQFGFTIGFHILFPTLTIGLAWLLVFFEARWGRGRRPEYLDLYRFWVKIFALTFGMGVVSGLVLSYEFGTNWSRFSAMAGPVLGPLLSAEVLTAFFVEAGFLGVMLFGWNKVGPRFHFLATLLVAVGTTNSAFWILAANSFMHTPQGATWIDGQLVPTDWSAVVLNPSFPYRLAHMLLACSITASLVVASVCAFYLRRAEHRAFALAGLKAGIAVLTVAAPLQMLVGDLHGLSVRKHQPAKLAAIEALWQTGRAVPLVLVAWPDPAAETNHFALEIPKLGSLILAHELDGEVKGLDAVKREDRPPVRPVFFGFRVMVGLGLLFLALGWGGAYLWARRRLADSPRYLRIVQGCGPLGFVATLAGWIVAEMGRQPWVVQGMIRTADAVSPVPPHVVAGSLAVFVAVYGGLFWAYLYFCRALVHRGPQAAPPAHPKAMRGVRAAEVVAGKVLP